LRVFEMLSEAADRPAAPPGFARNLAALLLHAPGLERLSQIPRGFLELLGTDVVYDARNAREILAGTGIECPSATSYIKTMVQRVKREQDAASRPRRIRRDPQVEELDDPLA